MYLRSAYVPHTEDGDFIQAGNLYCQVMSQTDRDHLVRNIVGHLSQGVERFIKGLLHRFLADHRRELVGASR